MIDLQTARLHLAFGALLVLGLAARAGGRAWLIAPAADAVAGAAATIAPALALARRAGRGAGRLRGDVPRARGRSSGSG